MKDNRNPWKIGFFIVTGILCIFLLTSMSFYTDDTHGIVSVLRDIGKALEEIDRSLMIIANRLL